MSNSISRIDIYIGKVGNAYVDKETARKNLEIAKKQKEEVQQIIVAANSLKDKLIPTFGKANTAKNNAEMLAEQLDTYIAQFATNPTKYEKLINIKNSLVDNDRDGIYLNGGNTITAGYNIENINHQERNINDIIEKAEILLEDTEKLILTRIQELNDAVDEFNSYVPEIEMEDTSSYEMQTRELGDMIDEVNSNLEGINNVSNAINNTTVATLNLINSVISESGDEIPELDENSIYWYAGQINPGNTFDSKKFIITENLPNTWHISKLQVENNVALLIAGIDSLSSNTTWYVIVPDKGFTPVNANLEDIDERFVFNYDVIVNETETYKLYTVNNELPISEANSNSGISRLNMVMSTRVITPEPTGETGEPEPTGEPTGQTGEQPIVINGAYWYIGVNMPTEPYNPEANLASGDGLGWRKIEGDITSYNSKTNPIYDGITNDSINTENDSFEFYFGIPQGCVVADDFNDNANNNYMLVKTVIIGGITYNFYKAMGDSFNVYIYYKVNEPEPTGEPTGQTSEPEPTGEPTGQTSEPEPTGEPTGQTSEPEPTGEPTGQTSEPEPTGEEPTGEEPGQKDLNFVFTEFPTEESILEQLGENPIKPRKCELNMNSLNKITPMYLVFPIDWLIFDDNENLIKPKITNSLQFELGYSLNDSIEINGIEYGIFDVEFGKDIYTIEF